MARVGRITRILVVSLVSSVALAACGDDGTTDADPDEDAARIEAALIGLDDLPDGYAEAEAEDDADETATSACNDEVLGLAEAEVDEAKSAESGPVEFRSDTSSLRVEITAFEGPDVPQEIIEGVADPAYVDCLSEAVGELVPDDVAVTSVDAVDSIEGVDAGDAGTIIVAFDSGGTPIESRIHAARVGRFGVTLELTTLAGEHDEVLVADLLELMLDRLRDG